MSPALQRRIARRPGNRRPAGFLLGFAWLALPGILQSQAQKIVAEKSGHKLSLGKPEINPLALSLRLRELKLDDPGRRAAAGFPRTVRRPVGRQHRHARHRHRRTETGRPRPSLILRDDAQRHRITGAGCWPPSPARRKRSRHRRRPASTSTNCS
jgi:hypothetical protein